MVRGRPPDIPEIRALIVQMAMANRGWGYTRIQGALANLHHEVSRGTIATILREHGLDSAPERLKKTTWAEFLETHWDVISAADFFTVDVWTAGIRELWLLKITRSCSTKPVCTG